MDTEDFDALKTCVETNNLKALQKHVRRLKGQNVFFWKDYGDLIEMVLPSKNKDMIEAMLPLVPAFWNDYCFMSSALEASLPRDVIELLQPPPKKQAELLKYFAKYEIFDTIALWSKTMNCSSLDEKIVRIVAPVIKEMARDEHEQYLKDLVRENIAQKENAIITSQLPATSKTSNPRKM